MTRGGVDDSRSAVGPRQGGASGNVGDEDDDQHDQRQAGDKAARAAQHEHVERAALRPAPSRPTVNQIGHASGDRDLDDPQKEKQPEQHDQRIHVPSIAAATRRQLDTAARLAPARATISEQWVSMERSARANETAR